MAYSQSYNDKITSFKEDIQNNMEHYRQNADEYLLYVLYSRLYQNEIREAVTYLLDIGANPNVQSKTSHRSDNLETPLIRACKNNIDVIDILLEHGADPNIVDEEQNSPLLYLLRHYSSFDDATGNHQDIKNQAVLKNVSLLLDAKADPNYSSWLMPAPIYTGIDNIALMDMLVKAGANIEINQSDNTPLLSAAKHGKSKINHLLKLGANPNAPSSENVLLNACLYHSFDTIQNILNHGANPIVVNKAGNNVFHHISYRALDQHYYNYPIENIDDIFNTFLQKGVDINQKNDSGQTPLMVAAASGHHLAVQWLIKNGANVHETNYKGNNALYHIADFLSSYKFSPQPHSHYKIFDHLMKAGCSTETQNNLLLFCMDKQLFDFAEYMVDQGYNVHGVDAKGRNALFYLLDLDYKNVQIEDISFSETLFKKLMDKGIDASIVDKEGNTPLMVAVETRNLDALEKFLQSKEMDPTIKNRLGFDIKMMSKKEPPYIKDHTNKEIVTYLNSDRINNRMALLFKKVDELILEKDFQHKPLKTNSSRPKL